MTDLVKRLRGATFMVSDRVNELMDAAADRIEELEAQIQTPMMREAATEHAKYVHEKRTLHTTPEEWDRLLRDLRELVGRG